MVDNIDASIAMDGLKTNCHIERVDVRTVKGKIYVKYNIVKKTFWGKRKIGQIEIFNGKVSLNSLTESLYGFQKDELMLDAAADFSKLFGNA